MWNKLLFPSLLVFGISLMLLNPCGTFDDSDDLPEAFDRQPSKMKRSKRIIWGEPLLDITSYPVMRYLVHITNGVCGAGFIGKPALKIGACDTAEVGHAKCGGALIREYIVQTACHCIATFSSINDTHMTVTRRTVWEHPFAMYLGVFDVTKMNDPSRPVMFLHHQKCARYRRATVTHDFGIIVAKTALIKDPHLTGEAPVQAVSELNRLFEKVQSEQKVCLLVGWGDYKLIKTGDDDEALEAEVPRYLQHSWNRAFSYHKCSKAKQLLLLFLKKYGKLYNLTYKSVLSWFCTKHFGKFTGTSGSGDSGAPVTCDDNYVGLISSSSDYKTYDKFTLKTIRSRISSTKFSVFENSAEYRRSFLSGVVLELLRKSQAKDIGFLDGPKLRSICSHLETSYPTHFLIMIFTIYACN